MQTWNSDIVLHIIQYLSVKDSGALAATAKRHCYLVHQYRRLRGPELVASTSCIAGVTTRQRTAKEVCDDALAQLHAAPNLALAFNSLSSTLLSALPQSLPSHTIVLGAISGCIQSSHQNHIEHKSDSALMLGSLPNATIRPFAFGPDEVSTEAFDSFACQLANSGLDWKVFMIYACGEAGVDTEKFLNVIQARFPEATIVGGICAEGYVSKEIEQLGLDELTQMTALKLVHMNRRLGGKEIPRGMDKSYVAQHVYDVMQSRKYTIDSIDDGIFGIAFAGDVPVRSFVSRGVKSKISGGYPLPSTPYYVEHASFCKPGDPQYMFSGDNPPSYHVIEKIKNVDNGLLYSPIEIHGMMGGPSLLGIRRPDEDGFELFTPHPLSMNLNAFLLLTNSPSSTADFTGANLDFFDLDGEACVRDVEIRMQMLQSQTEGEKVLGAVMFSCGARGPTAGSLINEDMADATRFAQYFPDVPCLGFYAGGEIGPIALAGRQSVFQRGRAALQGFTCVFALFVVPDIDLDVMEFDDSLENVDNFIRSNYGR